MVISTATTPSRTYIQGLNRALRDDARNDDIKMLNRDF